VTLYQPANSSTTKHSIAKLLSRVMLPAPMVIVLGPLSARDSRRNDSGTAAARPPMPWFVLGVVALVGANGLVAISAQFDIWIVAATTFLQSVALAAMGLETDIRK
jgi:uncharacterized membrane protein YadS